jgi:hypothetical protein
MLKHLAACAAILMGVSAARASLIIDIGDIAVLPGTPGQKVPIYVHGGDAVIQLLLRVQIADGGQAVPDQPITGPSITGVDVITGTIFDGNNTGQSPEYADGVVFPQLAYRGTMTAHDSVAAEGLLATITIDTTDFTTEGETFSLKLSDTLFRTQTAFNGGEIVPEIINGKILISSAASENVPEPATGLLAAAGAGLLLRRRKRSVCRTV